MRPIFTAEWKAHALLGDRDAIKTLAEAALPSLFSFCLYRVGRDRHLCEEVVQETLVRAIRELASYEPARAGDNIFPWLTGLARNEVTRIYARHKNAVSLEAMWAKMDKELLTIYGKLEQEPFADALLQREETRELVNTTMSQLPPHYREALEAKYVSGRSVRDIAALSSISEKAVESLLTRARQAFRATFVTLTRNLEANLQ